MPKEDYTKQLEDILKDIHDVDLRNEILAIIIYFINYDYQWLP